MPARRGASRACGLVRGILLFAALGLIAVQAAGLGKLTVLSGLGQPLRAEIGLTSVGKDEAATLSARLAPADAYSKSNIEYGAALSTLRFAVAQHPDGSPYLSITSTQPVNDPFLDMLIQLEWASGRLVREYTVLLDPPDTRTAQTGTIAPIAPVTSVPLSASRKPAPATPSGNLSQTAPAEPRVSAPSRAASTPSGTPSSAAASGGTYEVKRGDTATKIARDNKPDGVTLEQMLVAMLKANPNAFEANNVNRLHSGSLLQLPDAAAAKAVDSTEAQHAVSAQAADFSAYRGRLGAAAQAAPAEEKPAAQAASGKLTAKVEEKQAKPADTSDQLKLSKPAGKAAAGASSPPVPSGPSAEDLAMKDRALKDSNERVKALEKNVADLQKLLDLKSQNLSQIQKQLDTAQAKAADAKAAAKAETKADAKADAKNSLPSKPPVSTAASTVANTPAVNPPAASATTTPAPAPVVVPPPAASVPPPAVVPTPAPDVASKPEPSTTPAADASSTASAPAAPEPTATPAVVPPKAVPARAAVPSSNGFFDDLIENPYALVGLVAFVVLLAFYGIYHQRRKKKFSKFEDSILTGATGLRANSVFGTTGGASVDTANSAFNSNFVPMSGQMDTNEVDPVAEADVYIAYGRDAQAEEILKEALRAQPERHAVRLKLLEIYAKRQDSKAFETIASELYAQTGGVGDDWHRAATLGASFDANNPLYREASPAAVPVAAAPAVLIPAPAPYEKTQQLTPAVIAGIAAAAGAGVAAMAAPAVPRPGQPTTTSFPNTLPMEPILDLDLTKTEPISESLAQIDNSAPSSLDLDFDLGFGDKPTETHASAPFVPEGTHHEPADNLDFDLDLSGAPELPPLTATDGLQTTIAMKGDQPMPIGQQNFEATMPVASPPYRPVESLPEDPVDFSLDLPPLANTSHAIAASDHQKTEPFDNNSFEGISLDLDQGGVMEMPSEPFHQAPLEALAGAAEAGAGASTGKWQDMATKLDLAVAYRDIGDKDGARELLEEVMKEGDAAQIDKAKELMSALA